MSSINRQQKLYPLITIIAILLIWEMIVRCFNIPDYLLPSPSAIVKQLIFKLPYLTHDLYITGIESVLGFVLGSFIGVLLSIAFTYSKVLELSLYPYTIALKSVPIVAIAPLLIVWFGNGIMPKIIISAIITFFPVVVNMTKGLSNINPGAMDVFDSMAASKLQTFIKLRLPNSLPDLFAALKMSATLAVTGAIVGEFSGSDEGLGYYILISSHRLETTDMFVGIILSSIMGILFFYTISVMERLIVTWEKQS